MAKLFGNDEFEIVRITKEYYNEGWLLFKNNFMVMENVSIATNLLGQQETIDEMKFLLTSCFEDGVSFGALHRATKQLVGLCANKILNVSGTCTLDDVFDKIKTPNMAVVGEYLNRMEKTFDPFKEWHIDCLLEIMFLSTHSEFGRRGIALTLAQHSVEYAKRMQHGELSDVELLKLPVKVRGERPKAVCSNFTSLFTQKVGEKLHFETVNKVAFTEFSYEGKTFAEKIDPRHKYATYAALKL